MKKQLLMSLVGLILCQGVSAQITSTVYDVPTIDDMFYYGVYRVANNGQWAVASEGLLNDEYNNTLAGLLWSRDTGEYTIINPDYDGTAEHGVMVCDVSDNGRVVGAYPKYITDDGDEEYQRWWPAYKDIDGDWVDLTVPDAATLSSSGGPLDMTYCTIAKRISADGKIIVGECYMTKEDGKHTFEPVQWFLDDEGNVVETRLFDDLDYPTSIGFTVQDMSNDGSIIAGSMPTERNDTYPALIIDGELVPIAKPVLIKQEGYDDYYLESEEGYDEEPYEWWIGDVNSLDVYGNAYYYYYDGVEQLHAGVLNIATGEVTEYNSVVSCGIPGFVVGFDVLQGQPGVSIDPLYSALNMSDDGTVVAGGVYDVSGLGMPYEYPALIVYSSTPSIYDPNYEPEPEPVDPDAELYDTLCAAIDALATALNDTWTTITTDYSATVETLLNDYEAIDGDIAALRAEVDELYEDGLLGENEDVITAAISATQAAIDQLLAAAMGIDTIPAAAQGYDIYTLDGQKVLPPVPEGVYIINGKKVLVK